MAIMAIGGGTPGMAWTTEPAVVARVVQFDVKPQALAAALNAFAHQVHQQILFTPEVASGKTTQGVKGALTADAALSQLLAGTGLSSSRSADGMILISQADEKGASAPSDPQDAPSGASDDQGTSTQAGASAEEIVVTARKRAEKSRDVPISIGIESAEDLEKYHAMQITEYAGYIAGLNVLNYGFAGANAITLRGLSSLGGDTPVVATYVDDAPLGASGVNAAAATTQIDLNPFELERVEVLRGPQGTLWGANSIGGIVRYVLTKPDLNRFSYQAGMDLISVGGGGDLGYSVRGAVSIPLVPGRLAIRASGSQTVNPGFIDNAFNGEHDINSSTFRSGRLALQWQANDDILVKVQSLAQSSNAENKSVIALGQQADVNGYSIVPGAPVHGELTGYQALAQPLDAYLAYFAATIDWNLQWASLTSATAYSVQRFRIGFDQTDWARSGMLEPITGISDGYVASRVRQTVRKATQELRLASPAEKNVSWMLGAFLDSDRVGDTTYDFYGFSADLERIPGPSLEHLSQPSTYKEVAIFGNSTYRVTDHVDVTAGLRWARARQTFSQAASGPYWDICCGGAESLNISGRSSTSAVSYDFNVRYRLSDDATAYARVATGFRPGGPNTFAPGVSGETVPSQYRSDKDTNYEVGIKGDFFGRSLHLEAAVFRIDWDDIQLTAPFVLSNGQTVYLNVNGGKARSEGVELAFDVVPFKRVHVHANVGYSDPRLLTDLPNYGLIKGDQLLSASRWTGAMGIDASAPVSPAWTASFGGGVRYTGTIFNSPPSQMFQDDRTKAATFTDIYGELSDERWRVGLYVRNLFDRRAYSWLTTNAWVATPAYGAHFDAIVMQPRTIGLSIDRKF